MDKKNKVKRSNAQKIGQNQMKDYVNFQSEQQPKQEEQKRRIQLTNRQIQHRQQLYMKSKFQFVLLEYPTRDVIWDQIFQVIYATTHEITCPICMNDSYEIIIPYITPCGHVYCLPCFMRHKALSKINHKCPLCGETVVLSDLKSVKIIKLKPRIVGEYVLMNWLLKIKNSHELYLQSTHEESITYSRNLIANNAYILDVFQKEIQQLQEFLEICEEEVKESVGQALLHLVNKHENLNSKFNLKDSDPKIKLAEMPQTDEQIFHFYQDNSGQLGFLHPICNKYVGDNHKDNSQLEGRLLHIDKFYQTELTQKRYKFISHIPLHSDIYFYEIDLKHILDKDYYELYKNEMLEYRRKQNMERERLEQKHSYNKQNFNKNETNVNQQQEQQYYYNIHIPETFELNEEDFPALVQSVSESSEQEKQLQQVSQNVQTTQIQSFQQQPQKQQQQLLFEEESHFPKLHEESSVLTENPKAMLWGKNEIQPKIQEQVQEVSISELGFHVVNKSRKRKR